MVFGSIYQFYSERSPFWQYLFNSSFRKYIPVFKGSFAFLMKPVSKWFSEVDTLQKGSPSLQAGRDDFSFRDFDAGGGRSVERVKSRKREIL